MFSINTNVLKVFVYVIIPCVALYGCMGLSFDVALFPLLSSSIILLCGLYTIYKEMNVKASVSQNNRFICLIVILLLFCALAEYLGFFICAGFMIFLTYLLIDNNAFIKKVIMGAISSVIITLVLYGLIEHVLKLTTPSYSLSF